MRNGEHLALAIGLFLAACGDSSATDAGDDVGTDAVTDTSTPRPDAPMPDTGPVVPPPSGCPEPGAAVAEPYRWYPDLDLARIPFHVTDGPWGARMPVTAPEPPTTTRSITVTTAAELEREGLVPGTEITVTEDIGETVTLLGDVTDLDLIIPPGVTMSNIYIGRASPPSMSRRVRVRGPTPGTHSGGQIGQVTFFSDFADGILDGVDLNGAGNADNGLTWYIATSPGARFAIVNNRSHAMGAASLHGDVVDLVIAGNSVLSGARSREDNGFPEGWGLRGGTRVVVFDNRIEGNRYHRVRVHPGDGPNEYAWIADNVLVDRNEARIVWAEALPGSTSPWDGFWAVCNTVYAYSDPASGCLGHSFEANAATYARLTNNTFFGTITDEDQARRVMGDQDYTTDNTYAPWQEPPGWDAPGDPRDVPLPVPATSGLQDPACPGP